MAILILPPQFLMGPPLPSQKWTPRKIDFFDVSADFEGKKLVQNKMDLDFFCCQKTVQKKILSHFFTCGLSKRT